jgi:hypothetical protein
VCSPACATASKQTEDFIVSTRNKTARGARTNAYFCYGIGVVFIVSAGLFHSDLHVWQLTAFVAAAGMGFLLAGVGLMRVAKRNTEYGAA